MLLQAVNFTSYRLMRRTLNDIQKNLYLLSRSGFWSWFLKFFFFEPQNNNRSCKCQILPQKVGLHCVWCTIHFWRVKTFFLSSRKRQTTVRSFKIKTSWSRDASSTANTFVSSQVRTNRHSFTQSSFNLFILYGLMQTFCFHSFPLNPMFK